MDDVGAATTKGWRDYPWLDNACRLLREENKGPSRPRFIWHKFHDPPASALRGPQSVASGTIAGFPFQGRECFSSAKTPPGSRMCILPLLP